MQAIILLAGYGSRLNRHDVPHKCLLPFGEETLLSRHLRTLEQLGMEQTVLVVGHNRHAIKQYVNRLNVGMPVEFVENTHFRTTGNTLSLVMGLRGRNGDLLVMDGDVLYPRRVLEAYVRDSEAPSFAIVPVDVDDTEATKVLLDGDGYIHSFVTKRDLTPEEKEKYEVAGEAIGFFKMTPPLTGKLLAYYDVSPVLVNTLWEIPFTDVAPGSQIRPYYIEQPGCIEIDTQEDYEQALAQFQKNPETY